MFHRLALTTLLIGAVLSAQPSDSVLAKALAAHPARRYAFEIRSNLGAALSRWGDDIGLAYVLGTALIRDKQQARGEAMLNRKIGEGKSAEGWLLIGLAKLSAVAASDDFAGPVKDLARAAELNPSLPSVKALYGKASVANGNAAEARNQWESLLKVSPDFVEADVSAQERKN